MITLSAGESLLSKSLRGMWESVRGTARVSYVGFRATIHLALVDLDRTLAYPDLSCTNSAQHSKDSAKPRTNSDQMKSYFLLEETRKPLDDPQSYIIDILCMNPKLSLSLICLFHALKSPPYSLAGSSWALRIRRGSQVQVDLDPGCHPWDRHSTFPLRPLTQT